MAIEYGLFGLLYERSGFGAAKFKQLKKSGPG